MNGNVIEVTDLELSTILAALRFYQRVLLQGKPADAEILAWIDDIASIGEEKMDAAGIDHLIETTINA
jgi:hypothetical protein